MKAHQPTLWSDEDGVIAIYEPHAYRPSPTNPNPAFFQPNVHYYKTVTPDNTIIQVYNELQKYIPFYVLTNLTEEFPLWQEHKTDKIEWTHEHLPFLNMETQFHAIHIPKWQYAQKILQRPLCKSDILISDYNKDLFPWAQAGGTAVKYLNGINSKESYEGPHISNQWTISDIIRYLQNILNHTNQKGR